MMFCYYLARWLELILSQLGHFFNKIWGENMSGKQSLLPEQPGQVPADSGNGKDQVKRYEDHTCCAKTLMVCSPLAFNTLKAMAWVNHSMDEEGKKTPRYLEHSCAGSVLKVSVVAGGLGADCCPAACCFHCGIIASRECFCSSYKHTDGEILGDEMFGVGKDDACVAKAADKAACVTGAPCGLVFGAVAAFCASVNEARGAIVDACCR